MWAIRIAGLGDPVQLEIVEAVRPALRRDEVLVRLKAASLNYRDLALTRGGSSNQAKVPFTPWSDGCGIVAEVGPDVTCFKAGDRVCSTFFPKWLAGDISPEARSVLVGLSDLGVGQEFFAFNEQALVTPPAFLTDMEAATLPCAAVTAWRCLNHVAPLQTGDTVLLQGTGGVSTFALQFAKAAGLNAIVTSSSDDKLEVARAMGAVHGINYRKTPEWASEARKLTGGRGVDLVIEVGGAGTFQQSLRAVRVGGAVAVVGMLTGKEQLLDITSIYAANATVRGLTVGSRAMFEAMNRAIETHRIRPVIGMTVPWREAASAYAAMSAGSHHGKIVIDAT